jgi:hypothetical protein
VDHRFVRPEGWELGGDHVGLWSAGLAGLRSGPEDWKSHCLWSSGSMAWCAAPAILFINHGVEKPSMS